MDPKLRAISDDFSPLLRIMSVYDANHPPYRRFSNNISAFHIGKGFVLSVAHNLRTQEPLPPSMPSDFYLNEFLPKLAPADRAQLNNAYQLDDTTGKYHLQPASQLNGPQIIEKLNHAKVDRRFITLYQKRVCIPTLIIQFREKRFYSFANFNGILPNDSYFAEPSIGRHTFMIELDLVGAFYESDWSLYRMNGLAPEVICKIPACALDYSLYKSVNRDYYCLQAAPIGNLGRLLNKATIDGIIDHFDTFVDPIGGNYFMQGTRYLISGYFRFGSSGAPYLRFGFSRKGFHVNAIQSAACPLQLMIQNNRDGNFQYVNGIASPIANIQRELMEATS